MENQMRIQYSFSSEVWKVNGKGGWFFISLPAALSQEIRENFKSEEEGWGRMKVNARIGQTEWQTAIWFDSKANTYLLPLKSEIRKRELIKTKQVLDLTIFI